jgi:energy-coupling factor transport system permease protein
MELTKDITLGIYIPAQTPIHSLDPRTKLILTLVLITLLFFIKTYTGYVLYALFTIFLIMIAKVPVGYALRGLRPMLPVLFILWFFQVFFLRIPGYQVIFQVWILKATDIGLRTGNLMTIRVVFLYLVTTLLTMATSMVELTDGMEALLKPFRKIGVPSHELAMTMVIALRFVPTLAEEMEKIIKAQMARGVDFDRGNFIQRTIKRFPIFLPLFLNAFKRAEDLIIAMEARNYTGGTGRTKMRVLKMGKEDALAFGVTAIFSIALFMLLRAVKPPF